MIESSFFILQKGRPSREKKRENIFLSQDRRDYLSSLFGYQNVAEFFK